jgi:hypothetical protein
LSVLEGSELYDSFGNLIPMSETMRNLFLNNIEHFSNLSSTYNNILSLCATGVDNDHGGGYEKRGDGAPDCVTMMGGSYHFFPKASNISTDKSSK